MQGRRLLFLIPIFALIFSAVFFAVGFNPSTESFADDVPSLNLGENFDREYGEFILGENWKYDEENDVFVSYGNNEGSFKPKSSEPRNKNDGTLYQYECRLYLYVYVEEQDDAIETVSGNYVLKPYDEKGRCNLPPANNYKLSSDFTSHSFASLRPLSEENGEIVYGEAISLLAYSKREQLFNVVRRKLVVDVDFDMSYGLDDHAVKDVDENGIPTYSISRTYSVPSSLFLTDVNGGLVFDHTLASYDRAKSQNDGLYVYDDAKTYDIFAFDGSNVKIQNEQGNDVTKYYDIQSNCKAEITVNKLKIVAPTYDFEIIFIQNCINKSDMTFDGDNVEIIQSGYKLVNSLSGSNSDNYLNNEKIIHYVDANGKVNSNSELSVLYDYRIIADKSCLYPAFSETVDVYSLYVNESDKNPRAVYSCRPVLEYVTLGGNKVDSDNFELVDDPDGNSTTLKIKKKNILLYAEGSTVSPSADTTAIPVSAESFSNPYGLAYSEKSTTVVKVDTDGTGIADTEITVTFKISDFGSYVSDDAFYKVGERVILNVGTYSISPDAIDDWRYNATIDKSLCYTVTANEVSLEDLFASGSFVNNVELIDGIYVIKDFPYDAIFGEYERVGLVFKKTLPDNAEESDGTIEATFSVIFKFCEQSLPSIYVSSGVDSVFNYKISDLIIDADGNVSNVGMRINKKQLFVSVEQKEYDGVAPLVTIDGAFDDSPYQVNYSFCKGSTYDDRNKLKSAPVKADQYVVRVSLEAGSIYSFEGDKNYIDVTYRIDKRKVIVTVKSKGTKTFGVEGYFKSPANSNVATYTVRHAEDSSKPAIIGNDSLGSLSCVGAAASAKPSTYNIDVSGIKNANYDITIEYASGGKKETLTVTKITDVSDIPKNFDINDADPIVGGNEIELKDFTLFGNSIMVVVGYTVDGSYVSSNVRKTSKGYLIEGLSEGTIYRIKYVLPKSNDFTDLGSDYIICEFEVSTILTAPEWRQNMQKIEKNNVFVNVYDYRPDQYYFYIAEYVADASEQSDILNGVMVDIPASCIEKIFDPDDESRVLYVIFNLAKAIAESSDASVDFVLRADSCYSIWLMRRTDDIALTVDDVVSDVVYTKADRPVINKSEIEVSSTTITIPSLTGDDERVTLVLAYVKGETGRKTISSLIDDDIDLSLRFADPNAEIITAESLSADNLVPDTIYYVRIYLVRSINAVTDVDGNEYDSIIGEPVYFEIHTPKSNFEDVKAVVFLEKISGYFGVSTLGVLFVLLILLSVRFALLKRKWRI